MSGYELPHSVEISGVDYEIRSDFRTILDICEALNDTELSDEDRGLVSLDIFYPEFSVIPPGCYQEAVAKCFEFINCGEASQKKSPKLISWKQDFKHIVSPINRVVGCEIRALEYLHWWTFVAAYYEIGECLFSQIVKIRSLKAAGKPLDKSDREWYRKNRDIVDFEQTLTTSESEVLRMWTEKKDFAL